MKKMIERLLIFFIGVPLVFALVYLLPYYNHLALNIVVVLFSAAGAVEFSAMLEKKNIKISKIEAFILGALAPLSFVFTTSFNMPDFLIPFILMGGVMWAFVSLVFTKAGKMDGVINRIAGCLSVLIYPGVFMMWLVKMSEWANSQIIFLFLLIVFANDSAAWLFGSLFGKNNKGLIPSSPNKSIAGFIGGTFGSVLVCFLAAAFFPSMFPVCEVCTPFIPFSFVIATIGFFTSIFANLGDLAESAIKRSSDFKDSGNMMLGRGGILDSIDSIAIAAPVYYFLFIWLFNL